MQATDGFLKVSSLFATLGYNVPVVRQGILAEGILAERQLYENFSHWPGL